MPTDSERRRLTEQRPSDNASLGVVLAAGDCLEVRYGPSAGLSGPRVSGTQVIRRYG